jgi:hypothetical protein
MGCRRESSKHAAPFFWLSFIHALRSKSDLKLLGNIFFQSLQLFWLEPTSISGFTALILFLYEALKKGVQYTIGAVLAKPVCLRSPNEDFF